MYICCPCNMMVYGHVWMPCMYVYGGACTYARMYVGMTTGTYIHVY